MNVFYTSDLHFGHRLVADARGYASVEDHDRALMAMWSGTVKTQDIVWVLGDVALNSAHGLRTLSALPGRKLLVAGNHDDAHPLHRDAWKRQRAWLQVFEAVMPFARRRVGDLEFLLSHFPYGDLDRGEARFMQYRLPDLGLPLAHGHLHTTDRTTGPRMVHVGLDAWDQRLVPEKELLEAFRTCPTPVGKRRALNVPPRGAHVYGDSGSLEASQGVFNA